MRAGLWDNRTLDQTVASPGRSAHAPANGQPVDPRVASAGGPGEVQGLVQTLLKRAEFLLPQDRMLVEMSLRGQFSRRETAGLLNLEPGTVSRRLAKLGARLHDPLVAVLVDPKCPLAPEYRQLGIEHFLQGQSARDLAEQHQMTRHEVKRILTFIRGWYRGVTQRPTG